MGLNFESNILIKGKIVCLTGLHVGGVAETTEIGGTDSPVILDRLNNVPIIPGSSLKGKIRALLELNTDKYKENGEVHSCDDLKCPICLIFGRGATEEVKAGPTRLIVRDAVPIEETKEEWDKNEDLFHGTEIKGENWINRITSAATPRFIERVPAGSKFDFEMVYSIYQKKEDFDRLKKLFEGMCLLEDSYLGASGTRGYGKIRFEDLEFKQKTKQDYQEGNDWKVVEGAKELKTPSAILSWLKGQGSTQD
ncbi:MAG: type III-A CRISPR-associated RAMP protein Csm3 [Halobacteriota archaeon]